MHVALADEVLARVLEVVAILRDVVEAGPTRPSPSGGMSWHRVTQHRIDDFLRLIAGNRMSTNEGPGRRAGGRGAWKGGR